MAKEFDVMKWLREVRDKNAEAMKGLSNEEILAKTREATEDSFKKIRLLPGTTIHDAGDWRRGGVPKNQQGR